MVYFEAVGINTMTIALIKGHFHTWSWVYLVCTKEKEKDRSSPFSAGAWTLTDFSSLLCWREENGRWMVQNGWSSRGHSIPFFYFGFRVLICLAEQPTTMIYVMDACSTDWKATEEDWLVAMLGNNKNDGRSPKSPAWCVRVLKSTLSSTLASRLVESNPSFPLIDDGPS